MSFNLMLQYRSYTDNASADIDEQVGLLTRDEEAKLQESIEAYRHTLSGGYGILRSTPRLSPSAWATFVEAQELQSRLRGFRAYGSIDAVSKSALYRYVSTVRQREIKYFRVFPRNNNDKKLLLKKIFDVSSNYPLESGFDFSSIKEVQQTIAEANRAGELYMSLPFKIGEQEELIALVMPTAFSDKGKSGPVATSWVFALANSATLFEHLSSHEEKGLSYQLSAQRGQTYRLISGNASATYDPKNTNPLTAFGNWSLYVDWVPELEKFSAKNTSSAAVWASLIIGILLVMVANLFAKLYGRTARELETSQARSELAINAAKVGLIDWEDMNDDSQFWSRVLHDTLTEGTEHKSGSYQTLLQLAHPEDKKNLARVVNNGKNYPSPIALEFRLQVTSGDYRWHQLSGKTTNERGNMRLIGELSDLHERKETEELREQMIERLSRSNEELERFAFVASHDMQEPLRQITSFSFLALEEVNEQGEQQAALKQYLDIIGQSSQHMQNIIIDLLDYAKVDTDDEALSLLDCDEALDRAIETITKRIEECGAAIEREPLPQVYAHSLRLTRVFQNIIGNGIKYVHPDTSPSVKITCRTEGEFNVVSIQDNGIGIDEKFRSSIFEPFKRLHTRREYNGTGIGLSICKRIIESFGGSISVDAAPEQGSVFLIKLPVVSTTEVDQASQSTALDHNAHERKANG